MISALLVMALAANEPYVRSRVAPGTAKDHCLYWPENSTITWRANADGNAETPGDTEFTAFEASFASWSTVLTSCASLQFSQGPRTPLRTVGWGRTDPDPQNVLLFRQTLCSDLVGQSDGCWTTGDCGNQHDCWQHQVSALAITTTTYEPKSGRIYDADIELNANRFTFTTVDRPVCTPPNFSTSCVASDLQNTVTHEIGHMLGLDHTSNPGSTMNPTAPPGELSKRWLDVGTASFPCAVYLKGEPSRDCVVVPVSATLGNAKAGCSATDGAPLVLLVLALWRRRVA